jgi:hypothetical protein
MKGGYIKMDNDCQSIVNELNSRKGEKVMYAGGFGNDEPELAILHGAEFDYRKNDIVIDVICLNGHIHWGYVYQIKFVENKK